jgi:hypothetical protein
MQNEEFWGFMWSPFKMTAINRCFVIPGKWNSDPMRLDFRWLTSAPHHAPPVAKEAPAVEINSCPGGVSRNRHGDVDLFTPPGGIGQCLINILSFKVRIQLKDILV